MWLVRDIGSFFKIDGQACSFSIKGKQEGGCPTSSDAPVSIFLLSQPRSTYQLSSKSFNFEVQFFSKAWKITTHHKLSSCLNTLHQKWLLALSLRNCQQVAYKVFKFVVSILGLARVKFSSFFPLFPLICNVIFSSRKCSFSRVHKTYLQIWLNGI